MVRLGRHRTEDRVGLVSPLPGIWPSLHLDTSITLPVGVEAYAAYALRAWLADGQSVSDRTRRFAKWSAVCSFALGMAGQVAYHLLAQAGTARAPWPVTMTVSCLPVLVLAMGTTLAHMLRADAGTTVDAPDHGTGRPAVSRSPAWSAEDHAGAAQDQAAPQAPLDGSGPSAGTAAAKRDHRARTTTAVPSSIGQARVAAGRLAATGRPVSRRALRSEGIRGSNQTLNALACMINAELAGTAAVPASRLRQAPALDKIDLGGRDVDEKTDSAVRASCLEAARVLEDQIRADDAARNSHERTLLATIRAYRNINDRTHREIDDAIESLAALEQIQQQLVTDDLPRTRRDWLEKIDADLNQGLRALLQQIDVDRREITRGLDPINAVLAGVPFRHDSYLAIEPVDHPNSSLQEFRKVVLAYTRDNPLGEDLFNDETKVEASFRQLRKSLERLADPSRAGESWRRSVFDSREHVTFRAIETPSSGKPVVHEGVSGMSGGEGQELIAFILGAALRYRLGEGCQTPPTYGCVVLDEGFVKADSDYTGRALRALQELGFQLIIGAPREKATAFEDFVDLVAYISTDPDNPDGVRIYSMTIQEALQLDQDAA